MLIHRCKLTHTQTYVTAINAVMTQAVNSINKVPTYNLHKVKIIRKQKTKNIDKALTQQQHQQKMLIKIIGVCI